MTWYRLPSTFKIHLPDPFSKYMEQTIANNRNKPEELVSNCENVLPLTISRAFTGKYSGFTPITVMSGLFSEP